MGLLLVFIVIKAEAPRTKACPPNSLKWRLKLLGLVSDPKLRGAAICTPTGLPACFHTHMKGREAARWPKSAKGHLCLGRTLCAWRCVWTGLPSHCGLCFLGSGGGPARKVTCGADIGEGVG